MHALPNSRSPLPDTEYHLLDRSSALFACTHSGQVATGRKPRVPTAMSGNLEDYFAGLVDGGRFGNKPYRFVLQSTKGKI